MIKFLRGLNAAVTSKPIKDEQILYNETNGQLYIDKKAEGEVGTRFVVRDPLAAQLDGETMGM